MTLVKYRRRFPLLESGIPGWFDTDNWFEDDFFDTKKNLPAMNIKEDEKSYLLELAIPGFSKDEIEIDMENDVLHVSAEKKHEKTEEDEEYTRKEFTYNSFERKIPVPTNVNLEKEVKATYTNGVLNLKLTKSVETPTLPKKKIAIK